ncbi:hypothetical protein VSR34_21550 [Paraburkholderia sp. JHI2823]|uniref:OsmC family protein n=1 Tax=Paraburkholderia sp. JHI2823 TaxID=3112960 RepID=UPI00317F0B17
MEGSEVVEARGTDRSRHWQSRRVAPGAEIQSPEIGFQMLQVKVVIDGDATREELDEIVGQANFYLPVANSLRNPIPMTVSIAG